MERLEVDSTTILQHYRTLSARCTARDALLANGCYMYESPKIAANDENAYRSYFVSVRVDGQI